jgi:uncharacterized protein (TIGR03067 family)
VSKPFYVLLTMICLIGSDGAKTSDLNDKDLEKMQGAWHAVAGETKGTPSEPDTLKKFKLVVKKDSYTVKVGDEDHVSAKVKLRAGKEPKELDIVLETGPIYKGIYEINGDTLKMCMVLSSDDDSERPKEFRSDENSNTAFFTWERTPSPD